MTQTQQTGIDSQVAGYAVTIPGHLAPHTLTIKGRLPGLNEYTAANRTHPQKGAEMKSQAQDTVMWHILTQIRRVKFEKPVFMLFTFYEKDKRRDRDNVSSFARKVIQDALVKSGTLKNDGWDQVTGYLDRFLVDKENPRIVVEFIEQEESQCKTKQGKSLNK